MCVYRYPKFLEEVDVKKKKKKSPENQKGYRTSHIRSSYGKKEKEKEKEVHDINDITLYIYIYILKKSP